MPRESNYKGKKKAAADETKKLEIPTFQEWWRKVGLKRMPYTLTALRRSGKTSIPPAPPWGVKLSHDYYNMYRDGLIDEYKKEYPTGTKKIPKIPYDHIATKFD